MSLFSQTNTRASIAPPRWIPQEQQMRHSWLDSARDSIVRSKRCRVPQKTKECPIAQFAVLSRSQEGAGRRKENEATAIGRR